MDFVVAGLGFGAVMVVVGFIVRDMGPFLWRRIAADSSQGSGEQAGRWRALCHGIAAALTAGGVVVLVATIAAVLVGLSDSAGMTAVLVCSIAGIAIAGAMSARIVQEYRSGLIRALPARDWPQRPERSESRGLLRQSTGPLSVLTRHAVKPAEPAVTSVAVPVRPPLQQAEGAPFDYNRLLPEEFHHEYETAAKTAVTAGDTTTEVAETHSGDVQADAARVEEAVAPTEAADSGAISVEPDADIAEDEAAGVEVESVRPETQARPGGFKSPLLADIAADGEDRPFSSHLLADVNPVESKEIVKYQSPLFADLIQARSAEPDEVSEEDDDEAENEEPVGSSTGERA